MYFSYIDVIWHLFTFSFVYGPKFDKEDNRFVMLLANKHYFDWILVQMSCTSFLPLDLVIDLHLQER